jgi:hypothetical protein
MGVNTNLNSSTSPDVDIEIGELVLQGFPAVDRFRLSAAVERELSLLITKRGLSSLTESSLSFNHIDGGLLRLTPDATPDSVGRKIAQQVYRQLSLTREAVSTPQQSGQTQSISRSQSLASTGTPKL